eukprot:5649486-Pleurochrysis_carterae.AAC.1
MRKPLAPWPHPAGEANGIVCVRKKTFAIRHRQGRNQRMAKQLCTAIAESCAWLRLGRARKACAPETNFFNDTATTEIYTRSIVGS